MPQIGSALGIFHSTPLSLYLQQNNTASEDGTVVFLVLKAEANLGKGISGLDTFDFRFKLIGLPAPIPGDVVWTASGFLLPLFGVLGAEEALGAEVAPACDKGLPLLCLFPVILLLSPIELKNKPTQCKQCATFNNLSLAAISKQINSAIMTAC